MVASGTRCVRSIVGNMSRETESLMTIEQLRAMHQAIPFRPFTIYLADGRHLNVSHREFLSHSPSGRTVIVYGKDESFSVIDLLVVTELKVRESVQAGSLGSIES